MNAPRTETIVCKRGEIRDHALYELARELEDDRAKLLQLLKECREEIEGLDHGEGAPGMSVYQRQLVRTLDALLADTASETRRGQGTD